MEPRHEGKRVHRIVRLASEIEIRDEQIADVFGAFDSHSRPVIDAAAVLVTEAAPSEMAVARQRLFEFTVLDDLAAVTQSQLAQLRLVELPRIELADRVAAAFFPMAVHVGVERACPTDAAFEERELERREPPRRAVRRTSPIKDRNRARCRYNNYRARTPCAPPRAICARSLLSDA